jgi:hypothetical protein
LSIGESRRYSLRVESLTSNAAKQIGAVRERNSITLSELMTYLVSSKPEAKGLSILCASTGLFQAVSIGLSRRSAPRARTFFTRSIVLG